MRWSALIGVAALSGVLSACAGGAAAPEPRQGHDVYLPNEVDVIEARVPPRTTLSGLLKAHALPDSLAASVIEAARTVFDPRKLRADRPYRLVRRVDGLLREFAYEIDRDVFLRVVGSGDPAAPTFGAEILPIEKHREPMTAEGDIDRETPSLIAAMDESGEHVELAIELATIFAGDVDFERDLQPGDRFSLLFEKDTRDGEFAGYGAILTAELRNEDRRLEAYRFTVPGEKPAYYDALGRSLRRFFLKSPLRFEPRITSRFSKRRLHPVLGVYRAHLGVDYRAPTGAPVVAVASGVVTFAGWNGGAGRMVSVRHSNGYESSYLHLSALGPGIRVGTRVAQGDVVGKVGATGLATAPHLDYRLKKNGTWVNPVTEHKKLPPGEPIPAEHMDAFMMERDRLLTQAAELTARRLGTTAPEVHAADN